jgi:DNA invertase Pin-like site-specific DNA recombinase
MIVGYCRIGPFESRANLTRQERDLAAAGAQKVFCERSRFQRGSTELQKAIEFAQRGDVVVVTRPYRIAYTVGGLRKLIAQLGRKGVGLRILNTPLDTSTTTGRLVLGSTPFWSLGVSPVRSLLRDVTLGLWRLT